MSSYVLKRRQVVPADMSTVFAFFESPWNLERITPPWLHFEVLRASDGTMRLGTEIEYRLTWQRIHMSWRSRISEYEPGQSFADEMLRGPYARWHHRHLFRPVAEGVEMVDVVDYRMPFGPLGSLAHALLVRRQLEAIFDFRRSAVEAFFGTVSPPTAGLASA